MNTLLYVYILIKLLSNIVKSIKYIKHCQDIIQIYQLLLNIVKPMLSNIGKSIKYIEYYQSY